MKPRAKARLALLVGLLVGVAAVVVMTLPDGPPSRVDAPPVGELAPGASSPAELAQAACARLLLATQAIRADGAAATAREELAAARALGAAALRRDGRYAALSGALASLDEAIRRDLPEAAAVSIRVALEECERATG